ncbi:zinc-dependent alcohol dehydrogenase family protein [Salinarimonas rosea]|uniref:zinc-dependent alcohol dehydrogenase family protein n=1 Tax=Salinarimonas rosea TaxID=552063 RepID=UPI00042638B3|nr:zinc-dependent alcohol dehydrogenase family protein [Salinarimonas rosea]
MTLTTLVHRFGDPADVVRLETGADPPPGPGAVRVRMRAAAINPSDLLTIRGAYASRTALPFRPGFEGVGTIEALGPGVTGIVPGQRVLPIGTAGAWSQVKTADAAWCFPVPDTLDDHAAATSYVNPLTAILMLREHVRPRPGMRIGIDAAGSAIGGMLVRLAAAAGARVTAIVRHAPGPALLGDLPAAEVVVLPESDADDAHCALRDALAGGGLDAALDAVGGAHGTALAHALAPGGLLVHYGLLSGRPLPPDLQRRRPDIRLVLFHLRAYVHAAPRATIASALAEAFRLVADGTAASPIETVYPLTQIADALRHAERPGRRGKILLAP